MGWLENYPRSYYAKYKEKEVKHGQDWFKVYELDHQVYAIAEPQQFQEVNSFLILGEKRNLLIDTGMGICSIKPLVEELCQGEIITVNTHCHFDHTGNNHMFEPIYVYDDPQAKKIAEGGLFREDVGHEVDEEFFQFVLPKGFQPEDYHILPYQIHPVEDHHIFDLGNRRIELIHTGGHCQDHSCFYDIDNKILFTGDFMYFGAIYTHFENEIFGNGDIHAYVDSLHALEERMPEDAVFYCSHNDLVFDYETFSAFVRAFESILVKETGASFTDPKTGEKVLPAVQREGGAGKGHDYGQETGVHIYDFEGFSVFCRDDLL